METTQHNEPAPTTTRTNKTATMTIDQLKDAIEETQIHVQSYRDRREVDGEAEERLARLEAQLKTMTKEMAKKAIVVPPFCSQRVARRIAKAMHIRGRSTMTQPELRRAIGNVEMTAELRAWIVLEAFQQDSEKAIELLHFASDFDASKVIYDHVREQMASLR